MVNAHFIFLSLVGLVSAVVDRNFTIKYVGTSKYLKAAKDFAEITTSAYQDSSTLFRLPAIEGNEINIITLIESVQFPRSYIYCEKLHKPCILSSFVNPITGFTIEKAGEGKYALIARYRGDRIIGALTVGKTEEEGISPGEPTYGPNQVFEIEIVN